MGRSRGGLTTKIHALVDADGRPVRLELTAGHAADAPIAERLLSGLQPVRRSLRIRLMTPMRSVTLPSNRNAGQTSLPKPTASRPSASAAGSIASATRSNAFSIVSSRCAALPHDMTAGPTTTLQQSSSQRQGYGLHHLTSPRPSPKLEPVSKLEIGSDCETCELVECQWRVGRCDRRLVVAPDRPGCF